MSTRSQIIRDFLSKSGSTIISVVFTKKNGDYRSIQFNPRDRREIKGTGVPVTNPDIIRVRDFALARKEGKGAWRSFDVNRIHTITSRGVTYTF